MNWMMGLGHWRDRKASYIRLSKKFWISEEIVFAGSTDEPEKYNGAADLLVHPTFYDACSLAVLEALASGLPGITTASNGASGVISHGKEGWIVQEPRNIDQLVAAINFFLNKEVRYRASCEGKRNAETHSAKVNLERMMGIFREAAGVTL